MWEEQNFKSVTREEFYEYFRDKRYVTKQGEIFHSDYFIVDGEKVGYLETSSYGAPDVYKLKYGTVNSETISLVGNIIWQKK